MPTLNYEMNSIFILKVSNKNPFLQLQREANIINQEFCYLIFLCDQIDKSQHLLGGVYMPITLKYYQPLIKLFILNELGLISNKLVFSNKLVAYLYYNCHCNIQSLQSLPTINIEMQYQELQHFLQQHLFRFLLLIKTQA